MKKKLLFILILSMLFFIANVAKAADGYCDESPGLPQASCEAAGLHWIVVGSNGTTGSVCSSLKGIGNIICQIHQILNSIIPVLMALGVVYFVWGVVQYMIGGEEEAKKKGKEQIIYGLIGFSVIVGLWGLVNVVVNTFGLKGAAPAGLNISGATATSCGAIGTNFQGVLNYFTCIINNSVIPLIFALAVLMFVWGVVQFVINSDDEVKKTKGKQFMIWGIIALTVMVSVWGLVGILSSTFGVSGSVLPHVTPPGSP
ncbi:hypothetical protein A2643_02805 [Candidatus Nomurabacteria bacterium RIFCSPHIGHO2_01_FULL_39_220]|uniref:Yip1 domain-containing protein n=1 Tax=Candidatus Nomurabacteria bacterium RIFCSPLOWO2_02_FULL_40_67 TaxID=1801787 RepID=A0A1F6Y5S9_9BACT|nr:MAG: hypothetical protein UU01_C0029G0009 [Parcubacteria group bacterium GW2011_GWA2_40_37]KKS71170.1 MAG: hypothetical protein UV43_C0044G0010 [Parcubacteria group bacterium GW2011_GWF2_42_7]OGI70117.1 MAG: hypothetical protein A2643_02805 [Candidatus Nomurabacteria bacterium RIFCSPHIGHO2_01_FULL_39_220]OGI72875.1 MAG: hypothetical protein A2W56_04045 [Candidatus Nomurabacteria bacterium RIFCSPHIGHO2_02_41_18]OGI78599.1 MAG: hypothetical protein A3C65_01055 [Candidatus Nomurabacteria bacter